MTFLAWKRENGSKISTHTLTWSVTFFQEFYLFFWDISTHTLTWSVTQQAVRSIKEC